MSDLDDRGTRPGWIKELDMNRYSLSSDSGRWWWLSAAAGTIGAAVIATILAIPVAGHRGPIENLDDGSGLKITGGDTPSGQHPCFMVRPVWNNALEGSQPTCSAVTNQHGVPEESRRDVLVLADPAIWRSVKRPPNR